MQREAARGRLLEATLPHVPFDGWTEKALAAGAADLGWSATEAKRLFPRGGIEALEFYLKRADVRMLEALEEHDLESLRTPQRVALAIRLRLEDNAAHREAIRRGLSLLALPQHATLGLTSLYRTVDAIWIAAGDRSADFNWYTKRALLAGVYSSTLLFWLNDRSEGFAETWRFLDRRLADVARIPRAAGRVRSAVDRLPNPFRLFRPPRGARR